MAETNKLDSIIQIDGIEYEVIAKTAEKVAGTLTVQVKNNGDTATTIFDGSADKTITIATVDAANHVVKNLTVKTDNSEFNFNGSEERTIDLTPYANKSIKITAGSGLTGDGTLTSDVTLNVGQGNGITVSDNEVAAKAGNGITVDAAGISHADTSSQANITANGRTYITGVTLDTYGHVTKLTTGTETVTDTGATGVLVEGNGNAITSAGYNVDTRTVTLTKGTVFAKKAEVDALISSGTDDPTESTTTKYYFKY